MTLINYVRQFLFRTSDDMVRHSEVYDMETKVKSMADLIDSGGGPGGNGLGALTTNTQSGATYTLVLTDAGEVVSMTNASPNTVTVPPNTSVAFPVGSRVIVKQEGAGSTTLVAGAGVTINTSESSLQLRGRYAYAGLIKTATDVWEATGSLGSSGGAASGIPATTIDAKGDLLAGTADNVVTRVAVGTNGQVLTANSAASAGMDWETPAPGGGSAQFGGADATLAGNALVGDTSINIAGSAPEAWVNTKDMVAVGIGTPGVNFEQRRIFSVSGSTLTIQDSSAGESALRMAHAAGEPVYWIRDNTIRPWMYGVGSQAGGTINYTNQRIALMRMYFDAMLPGACGIDGIGASFHCNNVVPFPAPVGGQNMTIQFGDRTSTWVGPYQDIGACLWGFKYGPYKVTGSAATNKLTFPVGVAPPVATGAGQRYCMIVFPYGATAPGGVSEGVVYYASDITATDCKLYTDSGLTSLVDITSDGEGWFVSGPEGINHANFRNYRVTGYPLEGQPGFNLMQICPQQQAYIRSLFLYHGEDVSTGITQERFLLKIPGSAQGLNVIDLNLVAVGANNVRLYNAGGTLIRVNGLLYADGNETDANPSAILITGWSQHFDGIWQESAGGIELSHAMDVNLGHCYGTPISGPAIHDTSTDDAQSSWSVDSIRIGNSNRQLFVSEYWGVEYHAWTTPEDANHSVITDHTSPLRSLGIQKRGGQPPELVGRVKPFITTNNQIAALFYEGYLFDTSGGNKTLTIPTNDCAGSHYYLVKRVGGNNIIISPTGHTIDGAATLTISDDFLYVIEARIVSGAPPSLVYQWFSRKVAA